MIGKRAAWSLVFAALAIGIGVGALLSLASRKPRIDPGDARQVAAGEAIYQAQCARCHGANLEGQANWRSPLPSGRLPAPPHDESGHTWHHPDSVLLKIVKEGPAFYASLGVKTDMPGFRGVLSDQDIAAVISYIKSRWPPAIQARQAQMHE
jgi:mono/diheme cytochrome c family protein